VTGRAPDDAWTARLRLRRWRSDDRTPFAAMNADPEVMRHIATGPLDRAASDAMLERIEDEWTRRGHGLWALERRSGGTLLGFCGLAVPALGIPARGRGPAVEIGWRLRRDAWGHGYATEAARATLDVAWRIGLAEVVCLVHPGNERSLAVAERLGMRVTGTVKQRLRRGPTWEILVLRLRRPGEAASPPTGGPRLP
jgi:RimJ/RimL family protein N-acetyltransferase